MRKRRLAVLPVLLLLLLGAADPKTDKDLLQGTWTVESAEFNGKPKEGAKDVKFVIEGNRVTIHEGDRKDEATFTLDLAKKTIDIIPIKDEGGKPCLGIYELKDETLKLCYGFPGKDRPADFTPKEGSDRMLVVLKRAKK